MENRLATLKCKEVVNICDGCRLGYVCDVELDLISGRIIALLLPGPCRFFGLFGRRHDCKKENREILAAKAGVSCSFFHGSQREESECWIAPSWRRS